MENVLICIYYWWFLFNLMFFLFKFPAYAAKKLLLRLRYFALNY